jgi:hypothetical protein
MQGLFLSFKIVILAVFSSYKTALYHDKFCATKFLQ